VTKVYHKRGKDDWETPPEVFGPLNEEFGFTIDVAADEFNTKVPGHYFGTGNLASPDGLLADWSGHVCWCNPPYSQWQKWVEKAAEEYRRGATIVMLLPARTDTVAFHEYIWNHSNVEIRFVRGRIKFVGAEHGAPFPSMIVVFRGVKYPISPLLDNLFTKRGIFSYYEDRP
jgi:site-specific DNA-methyltransferase (adenine-specific)